MREQVLDSHSCQNSYQLFRLDEELKPRLPDPIGSTNHRHATQQNAKHHFRHAQHRKFPDMGLRAVLQTGCPNKNAYSTIRMITNTRETLLQDSILHTVSLTDRLSTHSNGLSLRFTFTLTMTYQSSHLRASIMSSETS
ncbi:hypothetical protein TNCV_213161 [Trichonephila clavipes]|nr:hypothetical protein TNCV_213161 [Trichonephila clavipes]